MKVGNECAVPRPPATAVGPPLLRIPGCEPGVQGQAGLGVSLKGRAVRGAARIEMKTKAFLPVIFTKPDLVIDS